jgi:pimeloyl-ACP methyl ester carboxylesterase
MRAASLRPRQRAHPSWLCQSVRTGLARASAPDWSTGHRLAGRSRAGHEKANARRTRKGARCASWRIFRGRRCLLSFEDPLARETVAFNGQTVPLAADFTVPLAVMLQESDPKKHELSRLLNPEKYARTAAIERLQPYDPNKTIVLVIHGLMDSQATWAPMINKLRGDPVIRKDYQFWFYSYPTGYPVPYSAAILRDQLDAVEKRFPKMKPMVVIGHSMGGCISRLLLTDSGNKLWMNIFGCPPDEVPLSPQVREYFREELFFRHRPEIGRVIFIASPLRGSNMATGLLGSLAAMIIREATLSSQASREMLRLTRIESMPRRSISETQTGSPPRRADRTRSRAVIPAWSTRPTQAKSPQCPKVQTRALKKLCKVTS